MTKVNLVVGDIVVFKTPKEIQNEYGMFNEEGFIRVGDQTYSREMYGKYKDYLYSIQRIEDDRLIFYRNSGRLWERITKGMVKRIYKRK